MSWKCPLRLPVLPFQRSVQEQILTSVPGVFSYISLNQVDIKFVLDYIVMVLLMAHCSEGSCLHGNHELCYPDLYWATATWYDATEQHISCTPTHGSSTFFNRWEKSHIAPRITSRLVREQLAPRRTFLRSWWSPFGSLFLLLKSQQKFLLTSIWIAHCLCTPSALK